MFEIKITYMDGQTESYPVEEVEALKSVITDNMDEESTKIFLCMRIADVLEKVSMTVRENKVINLRVVRFIEILPDEDKMPVP